MRAGGATTPSLGSGLGHNGCSLQDHLVHPADVLSCNPFSLQDLYRPFKLNVAAIGNIVSQLHVHVTGRLVDDPAWPGPCYGAAPAAPLSEPQSAAVISLLRQAFAQLSP